MATHLRLTLGSRDWSAKVDGPVVTIEGVEGEFTVRPRVDGKVGATHGDRTSLAVAAREDGEIWVGIEGVVCAFRFADTAGPTRGRGVDHDALMSPMPATVVRINVDVGARVDEGDALIVLEAMKMELPIRAPHAGIVTAIHCRLGELVPPGTVLAELD